MGGIKGSKHDMVWVQESSPHHTKLVRGTTLRPQIRIKEREIFMRIKKQKNKRDIFLKIRVTEEELEAFQRKY